MPCSKCHGVGHNLRTCKATPVTADPGNTLTQEAQAAIQAALTPKPELLDKQHWICPYCDLPLGNDHRLCICHGFNYSIKAWEQACQEYGRQRLRQSQDN